ncbi:MAG: hypothetical protein HY747_10030 [Elusimicrobia bacterium]|nr:hypothetical protein [Elusimicrobiota bacterium]
MVFENKSYPLGMIDEDLGTGQPSALAGSTLMKRLDYADLIKKENRHLIILKPRLEDCHCRTMRLLKGCSVLGGNFSEVHEKLNHSDTRKKDFDDFRQELRDILWAKQGYLQDVLALFAVCVPNR